MGFNSVQLGLGEAWDLTVSNWVRERMGFNNVHLDIWEAWDELHIRRMREIRVDLTVSHWV
jgi:hypothetical protein